jgi:hypothetical protein
MPQYIHGNYIYTDRFVYNNNEGVNLYTAEPFYGFKYYGWIVHDSIGDELFKVYKYSWNAFTFQSPYVIYANGDKFEIADNFSLIKILLRIPIKVFSNSKMFECYTGWFASKIVKDQKNIGIIEYELKSYNVKISDYDKSHDVYLIMIHLLDIKHYAPISDPIAYLAYRLLSKWFNVDSYFLNE